MATPYRRRWLRFRLRTILIVIALLAVPLAWIAKERRQSQYERSLYEQLLKQGFEEEKLFGPYDSEELAGKDLPQGWWRDLLRQLLGERVFILSGRGPECKDLTPLAGFKSLEFLLLTDTAVKDLTPLSKVTSLKYVTISGDRPSSEQINAVNAALPKCDIEYVPSPFDG